MAKLAPSWLRRQQWRAQEGWYIFLARRTAMRLGIPGIAGLGLILMAIWLVAIDIPTARNARDQVEREIAALPAVPPPPVAPVEQLVQLRSHLEGPADLVALVSDLVEAFAAAGVQVNEASFTTASQKKQQGVIKTQIVGTLQGRYPAIKSGLSKILDQHPTLALNAMALSQTAPQEGIVDARLQFTHWSRAGRSTTRD